MPHLQLVEDQSDSGSATVPQLTLEQLGLASDSDSDSTSSDDTREPREAPRSARAGMRKKKERRRTKKTSLPARGYLFEEKADIENIMDPADMGLTVLQARRKGKMELYKAPVPYMEAMKAKYEKMTEKTEGWPVADPQQWGDGLVYRDSWPRIDTKENIWILFIMSMGLVHFRTSLRWKCYSRRVHHNRRIF